MLRIKYLTREASDTTALQRLLEDAPTYSAIANATPVASTAASEMLATLPSGKSYEDKFVLGFSESDSLVACADLIRGYPRKDIAFIGLLLVAESQERRGYGTEAFERLCSVVAEWGTCSTLRLGVIETNHKAHRFWLKLGFKTTGESRPHNRDNLQSRVFLYERTLAA